MKRQILFTNLFALLIASTGCQLIADFKAEGTEAAGADAGGKSNKGGASNQGGASNLGGVTNQGGTSSLGGVGNTTKGGGSSGVGNTSGGTANGTAGTANSDGGLTSTSGGVTNVGGTAPGTNGGATQSTNGGTTTTNGGTSGNGGVTPTNGGTSGTGNVTATGGKAQGGGAGTGAVVGGATSVGGSATGGVISSGGKTNVGGASTGGATAVVGGASTGGAATGGAQSCTINGLPVPNGKVNTSPNDCYSCQPEKNAAGWSLLADSATCSGGVCVGGTCSDGCWIGGAYHAAGAKDSSGCMSCQPTLSRTEWKVVDDGTSCGAGKACEGGTCKTGCGIGSSYYANGAANPDNPCQSCQAAALSTGWSDVPTATCVQAIGMGGNHTCAVVNGALWCWGNNNNGQLGNNSVNPSRVPVRNPTLTGGVSAVTGGSNHTCSRVGAENWCWGNNSVGQLGNSTYTETGIPQRIQTSGVQGIAVAGDYSCSIVNGGGMCWGNNAAGQLGTGDTTSWSSPVNVSGLTSGVQAMAAGGSHSCAIQNYAVKCWGWNYYGQVGNGSSATQSLLPVQVQGLTVGATLVTSGSNHSCAVTSGSMKCWGHGEYGKLGNQLTTNANIPMSVSGLPSGTITAIAAGSSHTCAVVSGNVWCWGFGTTGQLGNAQAANSLTPVQVQGLTGVQTIASNASAYHTCAIASGQMWCWGANSSGELGTGSAESNSNVPVRVTFQ